MPATRCERSSRRSPTPTSGRSRATSATSPVTRTPRWRPASAGTGTSTGRSSARRAAAATRSRRRGRSTPCAASCSRAVPPGVTDDFATSTAVIAHGKRLVFAPEAIAFEPVARSGPDEFARKVRVMTRGLNAVVARHELLDPRRHGFYALQLLSHKVLRRLMALPLAALALTAAVEARRSPGVSGARRRPGRVVRGRHRRPVPPARRRVALARRCAARLLLPGQRRVAGGAVERRAAAGDRSLGAAAQRLIRTVSARGLREPPRRSRPPTARRCGAAGSARACGGSRWPTTRCRRRRGGPCGARCRAPTSIPRWPR